MWRSTGILLWLISNTALGDTQLQFTAFTPDGKSTQLTYQLHNHMLRLDEEGSNRVNLFNEKLKSFISVDLQKRTISRMDEKILNQRVTQLSRQRQAKIAPVEQQLNQELQHKSTKEQEIGQSLLNQLKYPEIYGRQKQLTVSPTSTTHTIEGIECTLYNIMVNDKPIRQVCMSDWKQLGIDRADAELMEAYQQFDYQVSSRLMAASGVMDFDGIDYAAHKMAGMPVEIVDIHNDETRPRLILSGKSRKPLANELFELQSIVHQEHTTTHKTE